MNPIIKTKITPPITLHQEKSLNKTRVAPGFDKYLNEALDEVSFSKHALSRLEERQLLPSSAQIERLNEGVKLAKSKGSQNSLVLIDKFAFVVSVKNKTIVTAMSIEDSDKRIFSQIDSTVIN